MSLSIILFTKASPVTFDWSKNSEEAIFLKELFPDHWKDPFDMNQDVILKGTDLTGFRDSIEEFLKSNINKRSDKSFGVPLKIFEQALYLDTASSIDKIIFTFSKFYSIVEAAIKSSEELYIYTIPPLDKIEVAFIKMLRQYNSGVLTSSLALITEKEIKVPIAQINLKKLVDFNFIDNGVGDSICLSYKGFHIRLFS